MSIQLLAISIGQPQIQDIGGRPISTGFVKTVIQGPIRITFEGPEGNKTAVHPDAVYAMPVEHYDYWAGELGVPRDKWGYGFFGENLTLQGIDEAKLKISDIITIGPNVKLQVTSARIPCFKLAWRLGQSPEFLRRFSLSGKTGFYLKVLKEGLIQAGDKVVHFPTQEKSITISELSRFFVTVNEATEDQLYHVLSHEHLGITGRALLNARLAIVDDMQLMGRGRWSGWREFVIDEIVTETEDIKSFWLMPADKKGVGGYRPGQFLTCRLELEGGEKVIRTWTISHFEPLGTRYRISVKKIPNGKASTHLHERMKKGSRLEIKPPNGSFVLDRSAFQSTALISAGIGITPMMAMLKGHLNRKIQPLSPLYFVHASQNGKTHVFKESVKELAAQSEMVKTLQYYSAPDADDVIGRDYDVAGHFKIEDLEAMMVGNRVYWGNSWHVWPGKEGFFFICGPPGFQDFVKKALLDWGVGKDNIYIESFNPFSGGPIGVKAESATVIFSKSGITAQWSDKDDITLLELAERCGIDAPNSCRVGVCETCECVLKKGNVYYDHGHLANRSQETALICCSRPGSDEVILEI
jgi:ferredoxin-NADP reductase/MOSC domain-containing protein YiiM